MNKMPLMQLLSPLKKQQAAGAEVVCALSKYGTDR